MSEQPIPPEPAAQNASSMTSKPTHSGQFMEWTAESLFTQIKPTHVSIALYDPLRKLYPIRFSRGKTRFPSYLVAMDEKSPIVRWFHDQASTPGEKMDEEKILSYKDFATNIEPISPAMLAELDRYHAEVCLKIETYDRVAGYLLIGSRANGLLYSKDDLIYFQSLADAIAEEIEKEEFYQSSHRDPLTGFWARDILEEKFQHLQSHTKRYGSEFALAFLDIDRLKEINDTHGQRTGDEVIRIIAKIIRDNVREDDLGFRYAPEEFLLMFEMSSREPGKPALAGPGLRNAVYQVLERLRSCIAERPLKIHSQNISATVSIGITFDDTRQNRKAEALIREARQALERAKQEGGNKSFIYSSEKI